MKSLRVLDTRLSRADIDNDCDWNSTANRVQFVILTEIFYARQKVKYLEFAEIQRKNVKNFADSVSSNFSTIFSSHFSFNAFYSLFCQSVVIFSIICSITSLLHCKQTTENLSRRQMFMLWQMRNHIQKVKLISRQEEQHNGIACSDYIE